MEAVRRCFAMAGTSRRSRTRGPGSRDNRTIAVLGCLLLLGSPTLSAAESISIGERSTIPSAKLDETRTLNVALPADYESSGDRYPVLIVLDGEVLFPTASSMAEYMASYGSIPELVVVGVENIDRGSRVRDTTPSPDQEGSGNFDGGGGAGAFLDYLVEELIPLIEQNYRIDGRFYLAGHSLSGLFATVAFMEAPEAFDGILAASPSLWWNGFELVPDLSRYASSGAGSGVRLFMSMGDEGEPGDIDQFRQICELANGSGGDSRFKHYPDQSHMSVVLVSLADALPYLLSD